MLGGRQVGVSLEDVVDLGLWDGLLGGWFVFWRGEGRVGEGVGGLRGWWKDRGEKGLTWIASPLSTFPPRGD